MTPHGFDLLDRLSNALECGLLGYNGELKSELHHVCGSVAQAADEDVPRRAQVLGELRTALALYERGDYRGGAGMLSRASRIWWSAVLANEAACSPRIN